MYWYPLLLSRCQPVPGSEIVQWGCIKFRLHYAVQHEKTIRFIFAVSAEHRRYNNTLYNIFYSFKHMWWKNQNRAERQFTQNTVRTEARKNLPEKNLSKEKNSAGNLGRIHGSCSEKPILRRLHGWKDFALIYKTSIPTKNGKL